MPSSPLLIVGAARSGTTLLRALFDAHPDVSLADEPELIQGLRVAGAEDDRRFGPAQRVSLLLQLADVPITRRHLARLAPETVADFLVEPGELSFACVYEALLPRPAGVAVWGEKSLGNAFYLLELRALYPGAAFVHIVRDPHAAVLSRFRKKFARSSDARPPCEPRAIKYIAHSAMKWSMRIGLVDAARSALGETLVELKYEDLVRAPETELHRICAAVGLDFDPGMLDPAARRDDPVLSSRRAFAFARLAEAIDPSRAGAHSELPGWAGEIVARYAGAAMASRGYAPLASAAEPDERALVDAELERSEPGLSARVAGELERARGTSGVPLGAVTPGLT